MPKGKVKRIVDGDTFVLRGGERVRIAGLKAPEPSQRGGQAAKQRLRKIMPPGTEVGLSQPLARSYDRKVRRVTVKGKPVVELAAPPRQQGRAKKS